MAMIETEAQKKLDEKIKAGLTEADLDEIVNDAASSMGSNANNDGVDGQIQFLRTIAGWSTEDIVEALQFESDINDLG